MKIYLLKEEDFEKLLTLLDRDPSYGERGGSSAALTAEERECHRKAHGFYNFQVRRWIEEVKR